jgi:hypothetical protein
LHALLSWSSLLLTAVSAELFNLIERGLMLGRPELSGEIFGAATLIRTGNTKNRIRLCLCEWLIDNIQTDDYCKVIRQKA